MSLSIYFTPNNLFKIIVKLFIAYSVDLEIKPVYFDDEGGGKLCYKVKNPKRINYTVRGVPKYRAKSTLKQAHYPEISFLGAHRASARV